MESFCGFTGIELNDFPQWDEDDDDEDSGNPVNASNVDTKYVASDAWYLSEIDLSDKQKQIMDTYRQQKPEAMVGNSIFVFRRNR